MTGSIWGTVFDSLGGKLAGPTTVNGYVAGIAGAIVTLNNGTSKYIANTNAHGTYEFLDIPAGQYSVNVTANGYAGFIDTNPLVVSASTVPVKSRDFGLVVAAAPTPPAPPPPQPPAISVTSYPTMVSVANNADLLSALSKANTIIKCAPGSYTLTGTQQITQPNITLDLCGGTLHLDGGTAGNFWAQAPGFVLRNAVIPQCGVLLRPWAPNCGLNNVQVVQGESAFVADHSAAFRWFVRGCWIGLMGGVAVYAVADDGLLDAATLLGSNGEDTVRIDCDPITSAKPVGVVIRGNSISNRNAAGKEAIAIREGRAILIDFNMIPVGFVRVGQGSAAKPGDHSSGILSSNSFQSLRPGGALFDLQEGSAWVAQGNFFRASATDSAISLGLTSTVISIDDQITPSAGVTPHALIGGPGAANAKVY